MHNGSGSNPLVVLSVFQTAWNSINHGPCIKWGHAERPTGDDGS